MRDGVGARSSPLHQPNWPPPLPNLPLPSTPARSEFPSNTFYEGALQNGITVAERTRSQVRGFG